MILGKDVASKVKVCISLKVHGIYKSFVLWQLQSCDYHNAGKSLKKSKNRQIYLIIAGIEQQS